MRIISIYIIRWLKGPTFYSIFLEGKEKPVIRTNYWRRRGKLPSFFFPNIFQLVQWTPINWDSYTSVYVRCFIGKFDQSWKSILLIKKYHNKKYLILDKSTVNCKNYTYFLIGVYCDTTALRWLVGIAALPNLIHLDMPRYSASSVRPNCDRPEKEEKKQSTKLFYSTVHNNIYCAFVLRRSKSTGLACFHLHLQLSALRSPFRSQINCRNIIKSHLKEPNYVFAHVAFTKEAGNITVPIHPSRPTLGPLISF